MVTNGSKTDCSIQYPSDWGFMPLGKCCVDKLSYGINAPAIPYASCFPSYLRITDINDDGTYNDNDKKSVMTTDQERYSLRSGDIVLARTGSSTGKSYLYDSHDGEFVYAGFLIRASIDEERHNAKYIVSQLRVPRYWAWVAASSMRSGQPGINGKQYSSFLIPIPSKKEQDAIAETLSCFDHHIANLTKLIEKKKAIRDGALEDLVSGRTRLDGFSGDWKEKGLLECVELIQGLTYSPENVKSYGTLVLRSSNIQNNRLELNDNVYVDIVVSKTKMIQNGDILICVRNGSSALIGKSCTLKEMPHTTFGAFMSVLRGDKTGFVSKVFESHYVQRQVRDRTNATINQITKKDFEQIRILLPSIPEQKAIEKMLTSMDKEIASLEEEKDKMMQIKAGAMDDLLTGRVRLSRQGG